MDQVGEFEMFVPFGAKLPRIGDTIETVTTDNHYVKGEECTIFVVTIQLLEWDMKKGGINVHMKANYRIEKAGLRLASGGI